MFENESYAYYKLSETPAYYITAWYDLLSGKWEFGKVHATETTVEGATVELNTNGRRATHEMKISGFDLDYKTNKVYGVVLTTAVTGSEMGGVAVLTNWARNRKLGYTSFPLTPKFSVLDPTYLLTLPAEQTTYGFVDMFCHTCEQYFSLPSDDNLSDEMAEAIQRHILRSWRACRRHPRSYEARSNAMWDSTFALNRVISRGKEEDWVTHGIEHALSAYFDISHGAGLAVVHPHWMKYVYTSRPEATARFARWAVNVWGVDSTGKSEREVAEEGIEHYVDFLRLVGAPLTLSEVGIPADPATLDKLADHAGDVGGSYRRITRDDARAILALCVTPVVF